MKINDAIESLCEYGIQNNLVELTDRVYIKNRLLDNLGITDFTGGIVTTSNHFEILQTMVQYAYDHQLIESDKPPYSDLFESKIMDLLMPRPSEIIGNFNAYYFSGPKQATDYFYDLSKKSHYIRLDRTSKNMQWSVESEFGPIDITVNLSKPEKDPKAIAAALKQKQTKYPKCLLCKENEGYSGHINHPGRHNHRIVPIKLNQESWYFQYSPYAYFNEHAIILKSEHELMVINDLTFDRLVDFVDMFPHYFIGSNADLPLVGGSLLTHDHYQSGQYEFPMERTSIIKTYIVDGINLHHLNWPLSVLRVEHSDRTMVLNMAKKIFKKWVQYDDISCHIQAFTGDERHNTVTPIVRKKNGLYQIDLVLRNNRIDLEHPTGIFHPHPDIHPVKKENIGLIEVMGLAVLPARLKDQMEEMAQCIYDKTALPESLTVFKDILKPIQQMTGTYDSIHECVLDTIGKVFVKGLSDSGVFKLNTEGYQGIEKFIQKTKNRA